MNAFTIKDLEHLSGIKAHTIRIWEQRYSFLKPQRTDTNIRYYSNAELKILLKVALLNKYGFKISLIDKMSDAELDLKIQQLNQEESKQEKQLLSLVQCMVDLDHHQFEKIVDQHIRDNGFEKTITQLLFQFLEKIGLLWQTNKINPSQEHLVTNLIRQKLIAGINGCPPLVQVTKTALLFLPEYEHHELGLLYVHYLLRANGVDVIYLGSSVPVADVIFVAQHKKPDLIYAHLTCLPGKAKIEKYLQTLQAACPNSLINISGTIAKSLSHNALKGIGLIQDLNALRQLVISLG